MLLGGLRQRRVALRRAAFRRLRSGSSPLQRAIPRQAEVSRFREWTQLTRSIEWSAVSGVVFGAAWISLTASGLVSTGRVACCERVGQRRFTVGVALGPALFRCCSPWCRPPWHFGWLASPDERGLPVSATASSAWCRSRDAASISRCGSCRHSGGYAFRLDFPTGRTGIAASASHRHFLFRPVLVEVSGALLLDGLSSDGDRPRASQQGRTLAPLLQSVVAIRHLLLRGGDDSRPVRAEPDSGPGHDGVVGLAAGLGAQSLVNDLVSGFFILFEGSTSSAITSRSQRQGNRRGVRPAHAHPGRPGQALHHPQRHGEGSRELLEGYVNAIVD